MSDIIYRAQNWKFWDLKSGKRVEEYELHTVTDPEEAKELVRRDYANYAFLSKEARSNPEVLATALVLYPKPLVRFGFNGEIGYGTANPICYAETDAITDYNIELAIPLGNIKFTKDNAISKHKRFVIACFNSTYGNEQVLKEIVNISSELKADPDIAQLFHDRGAISKTALEKATFYNESIMAVLPTGDFVQKQSMSNIRAGEPDHPSLTEIIKYFGTKYDKTNYSPEGIDRSKMTDEDVYRREELYRLSTKIDDLNKLLPNFQTTGAQAKLCADNGIAVLGVRGKNASIYLPRPISHEQFDLLVNIIGEDLKDKTFKISVDGIDYYEHRDHTKITAVDVFRVIKSRNLLEPVEKQEESEQTL